MINQEARLLFIYYFTMFIRTVTPPEYIVQVFRVAGHNLVFGSVVLKPWSQISALKKIFSWILKKQMVGNFSSPWECVRHCTVSCVSYNTRLIWRVKFVSSCKMKDRKKKLTMRIGRSKASKCSNCCFYFRC